MCVAWSLRTLANELPGWVAAGLLGAVHAVLQQRSADSPSAALSAAGFAALGVNVGAMQAAGARNVGAIRAWRSNYGNAESGDGGGMSAREQSALVGRAEGELARKFLTARAATERGGVHDGHSTPTTEDGWHVRVHDAIAATERTVAQVGDANGGTANDPRMRGRACKSHSGSACW